MSTLESDDYRVEPVRSGEDLAACIAVLDVVRREELNRAGESVVDSDVFEGAETDYVLLGCREMATGQIVGCIRLTRATDLAHVPSVRAEYLVDLIPEELERSTRLLTRLAILPEHRQTMAGLRLYEGIYSYALENGVDLYLLSCEPNLVPLYQSLGGRPYGRVHRGARGGLRVPMVFVVHDVEHFAAVGSPVAHVHAAAGADLVPDGPEWFAELTHRVGGIDPGLRPYDGQGAEAHWLLTRGLSDTGVAELLEHSLLVEPGRGDVVIAANDGGAAAGFVIRGMLEVHADDRVVALLGPGEIFGEAAPVLGERRTASVVVATDDAQVGILSQRSFERLSEPRDREQVWRNLAWILARKLTSGTTC